MSTAEANNLKLKGSQHAAVERARLRIGIAGLAFVAGFAILGARIVQLTTLPQTEPLTIAATDRPQVQARADIVDKNGALLATDIVSGSLYADARYIWDAGETADAVRSVLPELNRATLIAKFESRAAFQWIKRDLTPRQQDAIKALGYPALQFRHEPRRVYPYGHIAAHALGYVDVDNRGLSGVERGLDGRIREPASLHRPLSLSIDIRVQHALQSELAAAIQAFQAIAATGLVLDVNTGEIASIVSLPDFDPNDPMAAPDDARFNRATLGVFEMGSTFKIFNTAMVLELGKATLASKFDARKPIQFGRFTINDYHPERRMLTVAEIFEHSSNIGSARMALTAGAEGQRSFFQRLKLLTPATLELGEMGAPLLPQRWGELETMTISYGHGIAVNPIQLAAAGAAMVNGGRLIQPTLLAREAGAPIAHEQVISPKTSEAMRSLLRKVVTDGTGRKADVAGYPVSGKTGTAEKPKGGRYAQKALLSSFIGFFPAQKPRYLVLIVLDEPKPNKDTFGFATAGWTAAPTAAKVIGRIAPLLNVPVELSADRAEH